MVVSKRLTLQFIPPSNWSLSSAVAESLAGYPYGMHDLPNSVVPQRSSRV